MFDFRQERLDEIYSSEAQFHEIDLPQVRPPVSVVQPGFQLPASVWKLMVACYVIFFGGMTALVAGSGYALFMVVISALYAVVFFGTGTILANLSGENDRSPLDDGQALPTWCGPMSRGAVYGQVLIVPIGIAMFGVAVALIGTLSS
jgi:hypothetical protein